MSGFFVAPRFAWGPGAIEVLSGLGFRRATLLVDPEVARRDGARWIAEELEKGSAAVTVEIADGRPPSIDAARALGARLAAAPPEALVAVGGGRTIDTAKAAWLAAKVPGVPLAELPPLLEVPAGGPRLIAVPTTSGSGSEASGTADLVREDGTPVELAHRALVPDWALVDPAFAETLAPAVVVDGAFETLALAVEAYLSAWSGPLSDALALDAATTVLRRLPHAVRWSDDPEARAALHYAASAAGLAASNAQRGIAHALARALEGPTGLPYARLLGIGLPAVLEFDLPSARDRLETLAERARRPDDRDDRPLSARLGRLRETVGAPASVRAARGRIDWTEAERAAIVERTVRAPGALGNPRVPTRADVAAMVERIRG